MADLVTPILGLIKPEVAASRDTWGEKLNANFDILDNISLTKVVISETAPLLATPGQLWWENDTGNLFVLYHDGNSQQWVQISGPSGVRGEKGDQGIQGLQGPAGPVGPPFLRWACSDETTPITIGDAKVTDRMPYAYTMTGLRASLNVAQVSGALFTVDMKWWNGSAWASVMSTLLTFNNTHLTTKTADIAPVFTKTTFLDDDLFRFDVTQIGDSTARGLKITMFGNQT
jgi:hypothetical protein